MREKVVIALGGNALGENPIEQKEIVKDTAKFLIKLILNNYDVVVTHGNGPQVGDIQKKTDYPLPECGAMSQGYIGYHLQQALKNELLKNNIEKEVVTVVTQVEVDEKDPAFKNPSKPIGKFYTEEEINKLNVPYIEDSGRGYRKVVASPMPQEIVEIKTIKELIDSGKIVITVGGGGIPVVKRNGLYEGIDAVIDKDKTSAKLASDLKVDKFIILTAVDKVFINYGKENQEELLDITYEKLEKYVKEGQFAKGSMLPKIEASMYFVEKTHNEVLITTLEKVDDALKGLAGSIIKFK